MKILMLGDFIKAHRASCAYRVRYLTARALAERGHEVTYVFPSLESTRSVRQQELPNFVLVESPGWFPARFRSGGFGALDTVVKTVEAISGGYDIIHVTSGQRPAQIIPSLCGRWFRNSSLVCEWWEWHGRGGLADERKGMMGKIMGAYDSLFELPAKRLYDLTLPITSTLRARLSRWPDVYKRSFVLRGGAEASALRPIGKPQARSALSISENLFIFGMSNVHPDDEGDNRLFFDAFCHLAERFPDVRLLVTGGAEYLHALLDAFPCRDRVIYPGWLDFEQYNLYLAACDVFVLPLRPTARNAGRWPNKIGDYLSLERPILTNPTGDLEELFSTKRLGLLCPASSDGFEQACAELMRNPNGLTKLCADGRGLAEQELSFSARVDRLEELYVQLRQGPRSGSAARAANRRESGH